MRIQHLGSFKFGMRGYRGFPQQPYSRTAIAIATATGLLAFHMSSTEAIYGGLIDAQSATYSTPLARHAYGTTTFSLITLGDAIHLRSYVDFVNGDVFSTSWYCTGLAGPISLSGIVFESRAKRCCGLRSLVLRVQHEA